MNLLAPSDARNRRAKKNPESVQHFHVVNKTRVRSAVLNANENCFQKGR